MLCLELRQLRLRAILCATEEELLQNKKSTGKGARGQSEEGQPGLRSAAKVCRE